MSKKCQRGQITNGDNHVISVDKCPESVDKIVNIQLITRSILWKKLGGRWIKVEEINLIRWITGEKECIQCVQLVLFRTILTLDCG